MHRAVKADLFRYGGLTGIGGFIRGLRFPGFRYMYCLRRMANSKKYSPTWILFAVMKRRYSFKYGYQIPAGTKIGAGFYIGHRGAVVINERAIIGENCNIANGVTIGQANRGKLKGTPTIGDNVWIGTGAVIVGNINIGLTC